MWEIIGAFENSKTRFYLLNWLEETATTYDSFISNTSSGIGSSGEVLKHFLAIQGNVNSNTSKHFLHIYYKPQITQSIIHKVSKKKKSENYPKLMSYILRYEKLLSAVGLDMQSIDGTAQYWGINDLVNRHTLNLKESGLQKVDTEIS